MESMQAYPEPIVGALVFSPEGKLLLVRSHKWRDQYGLPGGHVELGETIEEAVQREVKEETGLDVNHVQFLFFQEMVFDESFWMESHFIFFEFVCKANATEVILNSEAEEYVWVPPEEAKVMPLDIYTKKAIDEYLQFANSGLSEGA